MTNDLTASFGEKQRASISPHFDTCTRRLAYPGIIHRREVVFSESGSVVTARCDRLSDKSISSGILVRARAHLLRSWDNFQLSLIF